MTKVFISYSHKDRHFVLSLAQDLKFLGADLWIDFTHIKIGDSLIERIREGIDEVEYVGAVISKNSVASNWVQYELDVAMNQEISGKKLKVLPILLDDVDLPGFLLGKYFADFRKNDLYYVSLEKMVERLGLDLDPLPALPLAADKHFSHTRESHLARATLYNQLGLHIVEWASKYSSQPHWRLRPEQWRRTDDSATYAFENCDSEMYHESIRRLDSFDKYYIGMEHLFSAQGILMREAVRLFREAASQGDVEALWNLGWRYELGQGVNKNRERAITLWSRAAKCGHKASREKLASMESGQLGV